MAILDDTDSTVFDEIRWHLDSSLTADEVPDAVFNTRGVLKSANRYVLNLCGMTATEYSELDADDPRRDVFEEAVIKRSASFSIRFIAQLVRVNANSLWTDYQQIDWMAHRKQLDAEVLASLDPYLKTPSIYSAVSKRKRDRGE